ncbi:hypothetical protein WKW77_08780 [Variovorax ureilyticus]|uniref:Uncharacterized protein n=1 Tax=Variovorax ureilyticus TaxID=1836198 RepID=A0ABU8VE34_9BURK
MQVTDLQRLFPFLPPKIVPLTSSICRMRDAASHRQTRTLITRRFQMGFVHVVWGGASLVAIAVGWLLIAWRGGKHLNERLTEQLSRSAALERECSTLR